MVNHSTSMINHGRISDKNGFLMGYFMASRHEKFREMIHEIIMNLSKCMKIWGEKSKIHRRGRRFRNHVDVWIWMILGCSSPSIPHMLLPLANPLIKAPEKAIWAILGLGGIPSIP